MKKRTKTTEQQRKELIDAIRINDIETIKRIIKEGINVNIRDGEGWTALHWSSYYNNIEIAKLLIDNGADVNIQDDVLVIPIHIACYHGYIKMVELLLSNGADVNIQESYNLRTPLHRACVWGHIDIAKLLIENGAVINIKDILGDTPLDNFKKIEPKRYQELTEWLTEHYPEKMLEYMSKENSPSKGVGL